MAKRKSGMKRPTGATTTADPLEMTRATGATTTADTMEGRVLAFAEQLGRIAGTVQAKTDGWLNRETLTRQIAGVRDGAAELLEHLGVGATPAKKAPTAKAAPRKTKGRSGGVVDAPGKKRRKRLRARPRRDRCRESGRQDAPGPDHGEDDPTPRARLAPDGTGGSGNVAVWGSINGLTNPPRPAS